MLKGRITQEEFNKMYVEYRKNYQHWSSVNVTFEMVCKLRGVKGIEFEDRMNYLDNNPPPEIEEMFMTPTIDLEERIKWENNLDDEGGYLDDDSGHEDFIDELPPENKEWRDEEDSNEY